MIKIDSDSFLMIEPTGAPTAPIIDATTRKIAAAIHAARIGTRYRGVHDCTGAGCSASSDNTDHYVRHASPTGTRELLSNSLAVHYVACHRSEVPADQLFAIESWSIAVPPDSVAELAELSDGQILAMALSASTGPRLDDLFAGARQDPSIAERDRHHDDMAAYAGRPSASAESPTPGWEDRATERAPEMHLLSSDQILGTEADGIVRQRWLTERGIVEQFGVRWPDPSPGATRATTYTAVEHEADARALYAQMTHQ